MKLKIRKTKYLCILSLVVILFTSIICFAEDIVYTSDVIIENASKLNGQVILYKGEAIGDIMYRDNGQYGWINVNDGKSAIGIWSVKENLEKISVVGGYSQTGDTLLITGRLNAACEEHGGDLDIHAEDIEIIEKGAIYPVEVNERLFFIFKLLIVPTVILLIVALIVNIRKDIKKE